MEVLLIVSILFGVWGGIDSKDYESALSWIMFCLGIYLAYYLL